MKIRTLNILFLIIILAMVVIGSKAQDIKPSAHVDFANWVIESNVRAPKNSFIKFYNAKQELIYQEEIIGKRINANRAKTRRALNQVLAQLTDKDKQITSFNLVAASLKRK